MDKKYDDERYSIEQLIELMLEAGYATQEIEQQLGVKLHVGKLDYIVEVAFSPICGEIEFSMN